MCLSKVRPQISGQRLWSVNGCMWIRAGLQVRVGCMDGRGLQVRMGCVFMHRITVKSGCGLVRAGLGSVCRIISKGWQGKGQSKDRMNPPNTLLHFTDLHFICVRYKPIIKMLQIFFLVCHLPFNFVNRRVLLM